MPTYRLFKSLDEAYLKLSLNTAIRIRVGAEGFCLGRSLKGLHLMADSCPHMGESLSKGTINYLNEITCPWHSYRYNMLTGEECQSRSATLKIYPLDIREDGVFFSI